MFILKFCSDVTLRNHSTAFKITTIKQFYKFISILFKTDINNK